MNQAEKSLFAFGVYLCGLGLVLLLFPNLLLRFFGAPPTKEVWIRINGMFVICLAFYYIQAARHGLTLLIRWTVWGRAAVIFSLPLLSCWLALRRPCCCLAWLTCYLPHGRSLR